MTASDVSEAWGKWVAEMGEWHVFGALTYDPSRRAWHGEPVRPGADVVKRHVRKWLRHSPEVEAAVVALEYHKNGWPHLHPLLRLSGELRYGQIPELTQRWFHDYGYAKLEPPRDQGDVAGYAAKYLSKDLSRGDVIFWPPRGPLTTHQPGLAAPGARPA